MEVCQKHFKYKIVHLQELKICIVSKQQIQEILEIIRIDFNTSSDS